MGRERHIVSEIKFSLIFFKLYWHFKSTLFHTVIHDHLISYHFVFQFFISSFLWSMLACLLVPFRILGLEETVPGLQFQGKCNSCSNYTILTVESSPTSSIKLLCVVTKMSIIIILLYQLPTWVTQKPEHYVLINCCAASLNLHCPFRF
jgi:hypothetical protein